MFEIASEKNYQWYELSSPVVCDMISNAVIGSTSVNGEIKNTIAVNKIRIGTGGVQMKFRRYVVYLWKKKKEKNWKMYPNYIYHGRTTRDRVMKKKTSLRTDE